MHTFGVTLLSGGLDSTTVTAHAKTCTDHLTAVTFRYGQTHSREVACAVDIARLLGVEHRLVDISFLSAVSWYSALTNPEAFPVPTNRPGEEIGSGIPITYVPLRNTIFIGLSAALLESKVLHSIEAEGFARDEVRAVLYMAPNAIDYSGYPDCRPAFYDQMRRTLRYGSKLGAQYGVDIEIETPIINMSKAEIAEMGLRLNAPLDRTWSCYLAGEKPCDSCDACVLRARGFDEAGIADPLLVRLAGGL